MKSRYLSVRHCGLTADHSFEGDNIIIHGRYLGRPWYLDEGPFHHVTHTLLRTILRQAVRAIRGRVRE